MTDEPTLTTRVLVEIRDELREIKGIVGEHTGILNEHTGILRDHNQRLDEQNRILGDHTRLLTSHDDELRDHGTRLGGVESAIARLAVAHDQQGVVLRQILRAVEAGNERRDGGFQDHERRIARLES